MTEIVEKTLLEAGYKKYQGKGIDVYYHKDICKHAGECVKGDPETFEVGRKPWIQLSSTSAEAVAAVIDRCPSGALKYRLTES